MRGTKANGKRPQLAILDDLVSDEDARSKTMIAAIEDTVHKAIDHAMHLPEVRSSGLVRPSMLVILCIKQLNLVHGQSTVTLYVKFPCTRQEFRGSWEDRFTYDYVKRKNTSEALKSGTIHTFNQELMLRIMSDEDRLVLDSDILDKAS